MIALIQEQVVEQKGWLSAEEFTDIVAISQMTPGPVGINTATYAGYTAVANAGYTDWMAIAGATLASLVVIIIPVALILVVGRWLLSRLDSPYISTIFRTLRLTVVGLIAAAALQLMPSAFFPTPAGTAQFSILNSQLLIPGLFIFLAVFFLSIFKIRNPKFKILNSPILLILLAGAIGLLV